MSGYLIDNKVYYKIFDKEFDQSTHIYSRVKADNAEQLEQVEHNINLIVSNLNATNLLILEQVHDTKVVDADIIEDFSLPIYADGSITTRSNIILGIKTADCLPLLLACNEGPIIGVAHCGWRGAKNGIVKNIIQMMQDKGGKTFKAYIGPCIKQNSYEVNNNFYQDFLKDSYNNAQFFIKSKNEGHFQYDLTGFVLYQLNALGINDITVCPDDTYSLPNKYPSYRYNTHQHINKKSNILSTIFIK